MNAAVAHLRRWLHSRGIDWLQDDGRYGHSVLIGVQTPVARPLSFTTSSITFDFRGRDLVLLSADDLQALSTAQAADTFSDTQLPTEVRRILVFDIRAFLAHEANLH